MHMKVLEKNFYNKLLPQDTAMIQITPKPLETIDTGFEDFQSLISFTATAVYISNCINELKESIWETLPGP